MGQGRGSVEDYLEKRRGVVPTNLANGPLAGGNLVLRGPPYMHASSLRSLAPARLSPG